jgi:hypothetical protein
VASLIYNSLLEDIATGAIDLNADTFKALLINDRPPAGDLPPLGIYGDCPVRRYPGWHVGHHAERR